MDCKIGLTQRQVCETLMSNGHAFEFLEKVLEDSRVEDHLIALDRNVYLKHVPELEQSFSWDLGTALTLEWFLRDSDRVVVYMKKEVGSLIQFPSGTAGTVTGMISVDCLLKLPSLMLLNAAQIVELEFLLNKAGETLGIELPVVRSATAVEQEAALKQVALFALLTKPKLHYLKYMETLKAAGTPVTMTQQEFLKLAEETFCL